MIGASKTSASPVYSTAGGNSPMSAISVALDQPPAASGDLFGLATVMRDATPGAGVEFLAGLPVDLGSGPINFLADEMNG